MDRGRVLIGCLIVLLGTPAGAQRQLNDLYAQAVSSLPDQTDLADSLAREMLRHVSVHPMENDSMLAKAHFLMGVVAFYRSRLVLAADHYRSVLRTNHGKSNIILREFCLNNLGVVYEKQNNLHGALEAYTASLRMAEKRHDSLSIVQSWINIGLLEYKRGNIEEALRVTHQTLAGAERLADTMSIGLSHQNLGMFYLGVPGKQKAAEYHNDLAMDYFLAIGNQRQVSSMLVNMSDREARAGHYARSDSLARWVVALAVESEMSEDAVRAHLQLASNRIVQGKHLDEAEQHINQATRLFGDIENEEGHLLLHLARAELHARTGNFSPFKQSLAAYQDAMRSLYGSEAALAEDQINRIRELDDLQDQRDQLRDVVRLRNIQLWLLIGLLILGATATIIILRQHARQKEYLETLYRINLKEALGVGVQANITSKSLLEPDSQDDPAPNPEASLDADHLVEPSMGRFNAIMRIVGEEKLFLNPELSIQILATHLATNQKYISQAINEHSGTNFYGLLRRLRVNESRRMILNTKGTVNLQMVAEASGFSNRTTFHRQFKEETGLSPSEFTAMAKHS